jgi:hypothetical protein
MVSLLVVFYIFVIVFAIIGLIRGWAQELLVTFGLILSFFLINVIETFMPKFNAAVMVADGSTKQFWIRIIIILLLVYFGYQTPKLSRLATMVKKEKITDSILGFFLGGINGYLVAGSLWYYLAQAGYPTQNFIDPESLIGMDIVGTQARAAFDFVSYLPPVWIGSPPGLYIAVGLAFLIVLVVFV